jgi:hypothetical protein
MGNIACFHANSKSLLDLGKTCTKLYEILDIISIQALPPLEIISTALQKIFRTHWWKLSSDHNFELGVPCVEARKKNFGPNNLDC